MNQQDKLLGLVKASPFLAGQGATRNREGLGINVRHL
jgi:hypothetical protein